MLPCINCKKPLRGNGKLFAEVLVCPDCYKVAEIIYKRGENELYQYLTLLKEMIRTSLTTGTLQLKVREDNTVALSMGEVIKRSRGINKECKKESTEPHVRTLAALGKRS